MPGHRKVTAVWWGLNAVALAAILLFALRAI